MLFNTIARVEPYLSLNVYCENNKTQVLHGCRQFVLQNGRLSPLTNAILTRNYTFSRFT
jgi:hypothetical protein